MKREEAIEEYVKLANNSKEGVFVRNVIDYIYDDFEKKCNQSKEMLSIKDDNIIDGYMQGMYNGMEFILSIFEEREPKYIEADRWNSDKKENTDV